MNYTYREGQVVAVDSSKDRKYGQIKNFVKLFNTGSFTGDGTIAVILEDGRILDFSYFRMLNTDEMWPKR